MDHHKEQRDKNFGIDWQGYNIDDQRKREERVDVSPAGTEGIFIDIEPPECDSEER
jgi:hypothetical protein